MKKIKPLFEAVLFIEMTASKTITGVTFDFLIVVITGFVFAIYEAVRLKIRRAWVCLIGTFLIEASFALYFIVTLVFWFMNVSLWEKPNSEPGQAVCYQRNPLRKTGTINVLHHHHPRR